MATSLDDVIEPLGFGKFSIIIILIIGVLYMGEAVELNLISIISPHLHCLWNLSPLQTSILSSTVFVGMFVGNFYWGYLSDIHGRKIFLVLGTFLAVYFGLLSSISVSYGFFLMIRFFVGVGLGTVGFGLNYIAEFVTAKHRGKSVLAVEFFYAFGSVYVAVAALVIMQSLGWRIFLLVSTIPPMLFLFLSLWLPESIRYLKNRGNYDDITKILNRISVTNNVPMKTMDFDCDPTPEQGDMKILFSEKYRWWMLILIVIFITAQCSYYGLILINTELLQTGGFCSERITVNTTTKCRDLDAADYTQNILVVCSEFPGILIPTILVDVIGRKFYLIPVFLFSGFGFLSMNICLSRQDGTLLMFLLRSLIIGSTQVPYVLAAELFPTVIRTTALGIFMSVSRLCLIGVPFLVQTLLHTSLLATTGLFAMSCFLSAVLLLFLPETKNATLSDM